MNSNKSNKTGGWFGDNQRHREVALKYARNKAKNAKVSITLKKNEKQIKKVIGVKWPGCNYYEKYFSGLADECEKQRELLETDLEKQNDDETEIVILEINKWKNLPSPKITAVGIEDAKILK